MLIANEKFLEGRAVLYPFYSFRDNLLAFNQVLREMARVGYLLSACDNAQLPLLSMETIDVLSTDTHA
jgi:hypothetical protein